MIKFIGTVGYGSGLLLGLGLSHANLDKLREGQPIDIDLDQMLKEYGKPGSVGKVLIFAGETELTIAQTMASLIGSDTKIVDHLNDPPDQQ